MVSYPKSHQYSNRQSSWWQTTKKLKLYWLKLYWLSTLKYVFFRHSIGLKYILSGVSMLCVKQQAWLYHQRESQLQRHLSSKLLHLSQRYWSYKSAPAVSFVFILFFCSTHTSERFVVKVAFVVTVCLQLSNVWIFIMVCGWAAGHLVWQTKFEVRYSAESFNQTI